MFREIAIVSLLVACIMVSLILSQELPKSPVIKGDQPAVNIKIRRETELLDHKIRTIYGVGGLPFNRGIGAKGFHRVTGVCKLVAGVDTVTLNTLIDGGKNDVSFTDSSTFHGRAWSMDLGNRGRIYSILPLTSTKFVVVSSDNTDTATILFSLEGD